MRYRDVEYTILQGIDRNLWKWSVGMNDSVRTGQAGTKPAAIKAAERAIDQALAPKKLKLRLVRPDENLATVASQMTVWIYGAGRENMKVFVSEEAAQKWIVENDPEGVAFAYPVEP